MNRMNRRQALVAMPWLFSVTALAEVHPAEFQPTPGDTPTAKPKSARRSRRPSGIVTYGPQVAFTGCLNCDADWTDADLKELEVWLPIPTSWREQHVFAVRHSPGPIKSFTDPQEQRVVNVAADGVTKVARWNWESQNDARLTVKNFGLLKPYLDHQTNITFSVNFEWRRSEIVTDLDRLFEQKFLPYDVSSANYRRYTPGESKVPADHELIAGEVRGFGGANRPAAHIARDVYRWVLDRTRYQVIDWLGAAECLAQRTGACGDYSALFVAACRSLGIPARMNIGFWAAETNGTHVWAEFQLPSGEWIPVDPSMDDQGETPGEKYFGWLDSNRLTMTKFSDVRLPRLGRGPGEVDFLQVGAHWVWGAQTPSITHEFRGRTALDDRVPR